jgi:glycosyltransferase involved in cell wall biosynthesis
MNKTEFLAYCSSISYPSPYANRLQTLQTAEALRVNLVTRGGRFVLLANAVHKQEGLYRGEVVNFFSHRSPLLAWKQIRYLKHNNIRVILCREHALLFFLLIYDRLFFRLRFKVVYEAHEDFSHDRRFGFVLRRVNHVFCITANLNKKLRVQVPQTSMSVLPDGVDVGLFERAIDRTAVREKYGIPLESTVVAYVGSVDVHAWKGVDVFLDSWVHLHDENAKVVVYLVVGIRSNMQKMWQTRYPEKHILFVERLPYTEGIALMRIADILVLPNRSIETISSHYTSPLKLFEYMASGVPIVSSDLPSIREVISELEAHLVEPDSPEALAQGIQQILTYPQEALARAARARQKVADFSWNRRAARIEETIEELSVGKDTAYYNRVSRSYSATRYPVQANTFVQWFFKERLNIVLLMVEKCIEGRTGLSILEIGCADGVVIRAIYEAFPKTFSIIDAVDISPEMIVAARRNHHDTPIRFEERRKLSPAHYDVIVEVGVLNYTPFVDDLKVIAKLLTPNGRAIISIAGDGSLKNKFSPDRGYLHFTPYDTYEKDMRSIFHIEKIMPVGFFLPLLWRVASLGRLLQLQVEQIFIRRKPNLFHEKVYTLSPKNSTYCFITKHCPVGKYKDRSGLSAKNVSQASLAPGQLVNP